MRNTKGFTILEVVLVVAIIAILAAIAIIAMNPGKRLSKARDKTRAADVMLILNAAHQYTLDNDGALPGASTTVTEICATDASSCGGLADMSALTAKKTYLVSMPTDPQCSITCTANGTGYEIVKSASGHITVSAPASEHGQTISATR